MRKNTQLICGILLLGMLFSSNATCLLADDFVVAKEAKPAQKQVILQYQKGVIIEFNGPIDHFQNQVFKRKLNAAKKQNADLVVVEINSPGGTVTDTFEIAAQLRDVDWAHTVAFIPEKALSGAAIVSLGCDEIIMQPTGRIGDIGVIFLDDDFLFKYAPEKIRSDVVANARSLAEAKGYSGDLVEAMIDKDVLVYQKKGAGEIEFTTRRANRGEGKDAEKFKVQKERF